MLRSKYRLFGVVEQMSGLSSGVEYICQEDSGLVARVRLILGLNVGAGLFSRLNDGVESASTSPVGVRLDCWVWVGFGLDYWCQVGSGISRWNDDVKLLGH